MTIAFAGAFVNPKSLTQVEYHDHALCLVDNFSGNIIDFKTFASRDELDAAIDSLDKIVEVRRLGRDQLFCPGFIDLHTHAPQIRNLGLGLDYPLLEWLEKVTYPEEISYGLQPKESTLQHSERISKIYEQMIRAMLKYGTTTCCYFGSLQNEANRVLLDVICSSGQRALIGKTCMDCHSPSNYMEDTETSIGESIRFIEMVKAKDCSDMVMPIITPRFALCCTSEAMKKLAAVAHEYDIHIQTHMSENREENQRASELFPSCSDYASIYKLHDLLTERTILAHCIYVSDDEKRLLAQQGVGVAHCPNSNFALSSGIMDVRSFIEAGINVGLGTDISGGYGISILDAMRQAIIASRALSFSNNQIKSLTVEEVFYLATLGGAKALRFDNRIGNFAIGKAFDAILVDLTACPVPRKDDETLKESLQRFIFLGDDRWISSTFVNGFLLY